MATDPMGAPPAPPASAGMSEDAVKFFLRVIAVVSLAFGAAALLVPSVLTALYEVDDTDAVAAALRFFGAESLAWGLAVWFLAGVREAWRGLVTASLVLQVLLIASAIVAMATGAAGPFMWQVVALSGVFAVIALWARRTA